MTGNVFLILGCGYTGERVARRLIGRGARVVATSREPDRLRNIASTGAEVRFTDLAQPETLTSALEDLPADLRVLHSIPIIKRDNEKVDPTAMLLSALGAKPARLVYLSTTGVYGGAREVDETTPPDRTSARARRRLEAEDAVRSGTWSWMILRPAAIYGPGRGVHESLRQGRFRLVEDGANYVSRIHVDDLAALSEAALLSDLTGTYPVADLEPCPSREIAGFCAELLGLPFPSSITGEQAHHTRRVNRKVDGRAAFHKLGVRLRYPSYRQGIPASLSGLNSNLSWETGQSPAAG